MKKGWFAVFVQGNISAIQLDELASEQGIEHVHHEEYETDGVDERDSEVEVGIAPTTAHPQVEHDRRQNHRSNQHARIDQEVAKKREEKSRHREQRQEKA